MTRRPARGRPVAVLNGAVAAALVAIVAAVALVVNPPAPPGIAEFAPQAAKAITKAPPDQSSEFGSGADGACKGRQKCDRRIDPKTGKPLRPGAPVGGPGDDRPKGVPSALQCFTWGDGTVTQTFDPQSPPCIATWDTKAGNGGATSQGVSATEIRVGVTAKIGDDIKALSAFFNNHFQFYGRSIRLVQVPSAGNANTPSGQHAAAQQAAALGLFAATHITQAGQQTWRDALAAKGIISTSGDSDFTLTGDLGRLAPYAWSFSPTLDTLERSLAEFACKALVGKDAEYSSDPLLKTSERSFAVLLHSGDVPAPATEPLTDNLSACGASIRVVSHDNNDTTNDKAVATKLQQDGVTTLIPVGFVPDNFMYTASRIGYHPEWLGLGTADQYWMDTGWSPNAPDQNPGVFGLVSGNKWLPFTTRPSYRAIKEIAPNRSTDEGASFAADQNYHELLLIASGIQMAGPKLTPQSFQAGLQRTAFPNPGAGSTPDYQARVDFAGGSHTMISDIGLFRWSATAPGNYSGRGGVTQGGWCYAGGGQRWSLGGWPGQDPTRSGC